jgi:membrane-associated protease RseP (regulator of RpoE activity)
MPPLMPTDSTTAEDVSVPEEGRRFALPVILFLATCLSTFWLGAEAWNPTGRIALFLGNAKANWPQGSPLAALNEARAIATNEMDWRQGLVYMGVVMGLLLAHEMGHFLMALRHRIPASLPYFIPLPIIPFGTLGAVIGMEGSRANRRQMFDLGIAGPLAGLAVTLPILWLGIVRLPGTPMGGQSFCFHNPLLLKYMIAWLRPDYPTPGVLYLNQFNSFLMAGWVGMLVTGLNMLPVSQLDGGHVAYALLGERAHLLARTLIVAAILYILATESYFWVVMLVLVILLGADHPPTADDRCRLGWMRWVLGWASLLIPLLCFPPRGITPFGR